jgi:AcrR family transcriptional regulator
VTDRDAPRKRRGAYAKGIKRRQEILDRALDVFLERGFQGTSLRAIAEEIGVNHAALLHYFPSREALLLEVIDQRDQQLDRLAASQPNYFDAIRFGVQRNAEVPGYVALFTSLLGSSVEPKNTLAREFFANRFVEGRKRIRTRLEAELRAEGHKADVDLDKFAALIMAASDGLQVQYLLDQTMHTDEIIDMLRDLLVVRKDRAAEG